MPSAVIDPSTTPPLAFARLDCEAVAPGRGPLRWRLAGRTADGRRWLLHVDSLDVVDNPVAAAVPLPARLTRASLALVEPHADPLAGPLAGPLAEAQVDLAAVPGASAAPRRWAIASDEGRFELGLVRMFVHEDVSELAAQAVPPRRVPLGKRVFWRAVFALLATRAGRRWLERRAAA